MSVDVVFLICTFLFINFTWRSNLAAEGLTGFFISQLNLFILPNFKKALKQKVLKFRLLSFLAYKTFHKVQGFNWNITENISQ